MNIDIIEELIDMTKGETVRAFRTEPKKAYKSLLCGILRDILFFGNFYTTVPTFYGWAKMMNHAREFKAGDPNAGYPHYVDLTKKELRRSYYKNPNDVDSILLFFRSMLEEMKSKNKVLFTVTEISKIVDVVTYFEAKSVPLKPHHWIEINFTTGMIPTHPEFFNYMDVINCWNDLITKVKNLEKVEIESREYRALRHSITSSMRWLVIQGVTFVEAYLYYYFYNLSNDAMSVRSLPNFKGNVQDTQIVKQVLLVLHPNLKSDEEFMWLYEKYTSILKLRDRFVHSSAFPNQANQLSELHPLLSLSVGKTAEILTDSFTFVNKIEGSLPTSEKLLYWKDRFEEPEFSQLSIISPLNIYR